jgi:hypothetical protein
MTTRLLFYPAGDKIVAVSLRSGRGCMIHLRVIKGSEGCDDGNAERFRATDQAAGEDAPSTLRVANSNGSGEAIDSDGEFHTIFEDFPGKRGGNFYAAGPAVMAFAAVGDVGPTFQEDAPAALVDYGVQPAFQSYEIAPSIGSRLRQTRQGIGSLARSQHQFLSIGGSVADPALDLDADDLKRRAWGQHRAKTLKCFLDGVYLWAAGTTDGNRNPYLFHVTPFAEKRANAPIVRQTGDFGGNYEARAQRAEIDLNKVVSIS